MRPSEPYELVDIGLNLAHRRFDADRDAVVERALAAGVAQMVVTGTSVQGSHAAVQLAHSQRGVLFATAGVHPHDASRCDGDTLTSLAELAQSISVVAIGECGLDFNRNFSPPDVQEQWFIAQLGLAVEIGLPVFLHERDAYSRFASILGEVLPDLPGAVVHCFTGSDEALDAYLDMGAHIGITGWICDERRGLDLRDQVRRIPLNRLMVETDAPYLTPRDLRPKPQNGRNEPAYLAHVLETVANCRGEAIEEVAAGTTKTARAFFSL